jgi:hypothetical protein
MKYRRRRVSDSLEIDPIEPIGVPIGKLASKRQD